MVNTKTCSQRPTLKILHGRKIREPGFIIIGIVAIILALLVFLLLKTNFLQGTPYCLPHCPHTAHRGLWQFIKDQMPTENRMAAPTTQTPQSQDKRNSTEKEGRILYCTGGWKEAATCCRYHIDISLSFQPDKSFWYGVGLGLTIQAVIMPRHGLFAEARAKFIRMGWRSLRRRCENGIWNFGKFDNDQFLFNPGFFFLIHDSCSLFDIENVRIC